MEPHEPIETRQEHGQLASAGPEDTAMKDEDQVTVTVETQPSTASEITIIAEDGDLIAVVGRGRVRFRVHSLILKMRSPVLEKTISNAQKNRTPTDDRILEVLMPEFDPNAFESLYSHFHKSKSNAFPLTVELVLKVAVLAKKWGCVDGLADASNSWMEKLRLSQAWYQTDSCWSLTVAALYFNSDRWFRAYSSRLIELHKTSFLGFAEKVPGSFKLLKLAYALEENRHLRVTEPPLDLSGLPPGTAGPSSAMFTDRNPQTDETQQYENILLQEPYRKWSMDELRLSDYMQDHRYGIEYGVMSSGKRNPFQPSPPLGLCLGCFGLARESFQPRDDCRQCQSRLSGQTIIDYQNFNNFGQMVLPRPSMSSESHGTSQQIVPVTGSIFGSATRGVANQSTPTAGGLFGSASNTPAQGLLSAPNESFSVGIPPKKNPCFVSAENQVSQASNTAPGGSFGSVNNALSQQPSQPVMRDLFSPQPAQSSGGSTYHFVGCGANASTQPTRDNVEITVATSDAKETTPKPKDNGGGLFGASSTTSVASPKTTGGNGGLFGSSSGPLPGGSGGFGSATSSNAANKNESGGSKAHTPKANSATPAPVVAPRIFGASHSSTGTPTPTNPPTGPSRGASGERGASPGWLFGAPSAGPNTSNKRSGSQQESDRGAKRQKQG